MTTEVTIARIIHPHILSCRPDTLLSEAARRMAEARCSSILVVDDGQAVGIWTERDALSLDLGKPQSFDEPIARHMTAPVKTIHANTGVGEAALRFREEKVRHFLVVDDAGSHQGIVTQTDIVVNQGIEYYLTLREMRSVLNSSYPFVPSTMPMDEAVRQMYAARLDAVLVAYPDDSHGIVTERDVLQLVVSRRPPATVGDLAKRPLISVPAQASVYHARQLFAERRIRHLGVTDSDGRLLGLVAFGDILSSIEHDYVQQLRETLKEREHALAVSMQQQRLASKVFESTLEGIMVTNTRSVIESVNPAFTQITGYKAHEVIGKSPAILSSGRHDGSFYRAMWSDLAVHGHWQGEVWNRRKNGEIYPEWLTINTVRNESGQIVNYVGVFSDITKRKAAEEQMQFLAYHDGLTGLPNRGLFLDRLHHAVAHAHRNQSGVAVMFLDLDNFKPVNDTHGHHVGDRLLQIIAQRLVASVREADTVARLGGDEFTVILESITDADDVAPITRKIIDAITTSIGISLYPAHGGQADELIRRADSAMYAAKNGGRNNFRFYAAGMREHAHSARDEAG